MRTGNLWQHLRQLQQLQQLRQLPRRASPRAALLVACALGLAACGATPVQGGNGTPTPSYGTGAGHILIQLYSTPGFIYPPIVGIPEWTLYGDGTLLARNLPGQTAAAPSGLVVAHLSADQVTHILDVVVNQYAFFASTRDAYGRPVPDVGATRFTVSVDGKSKTVSLLPQSDPSPDQQTANVFAAAKFVRNYKPASAAPYQPQGVGLLVFKAGAVGSTVPAPQAWPFSDVSLATAYAYNCSYLHTGTSCPVAPGGSPGLTAVYGARSADILTFLAGTSTAAQNGAIYRVLAYPLLPDSLHPDTGAPGLRVMFSSGEQWTPLVAAQPAA
jgi:hypothetical protein